MLECKSVYLGVDKPGIFIQVEINPEDDCAQKLLCPTSSLGRHCRILLAKSLRATGLSLSTDELWYHLLRQKDGQRWTPNLQLILAEDNEFVAFQPYTMEQQDFLFRLSRQVVSIRDLSPNRVSR